MKNFRLLVTRKVSSSLVLRAGLNGIDILEKEFIAVEPIVSDELRKRIDVITSSEQPVAFTSRNAVHAVAVNIDLKKADWKIFCLEGATAKEVKKYISQEKIVATAQNAEALANHISENIPEKKIVFFCGNLRRDDLPEILRTSGCDVEEIVVYETVLVPHAIVDDYEAIAFFSPSAVKSFFSVNKLKDGVFCISVGNTTSEAIREFSQNKIITAKWPSEESVFELAKEIKNNV